MSERHTLEVPRTARYCLLEGEPEHVRAILFVLHGYGQLAAPFLASLTGLAVPARTLVAPEALSRYYLRRGTGEVGASWMTREERAGEIADNLRYLDLLWARVRASAPPSARLGAFGFSQGGATAARWALLGSAPVERVTLWGCALPPDLDLACHAERARRVEWCFVLGDADASLERTAWEAGLARLRAHGIEPEVRRFPGGHELESATLARLP